jgi:hypothetical protein
MNQQDEAAIVIRKATAMTAIWRQSNDGYVEQVLRSDGDAGIAGVDVEVGGKQISLGILQIREGARASHVLIIGSGEEVRVNGQPVMGGFRVLQHRDELVVETARLFFSAESTPVLETYHHDESARRPKCGVCRAEIRDGQTVVRCPGCNRIFHQIAAAGDAPEKNCFSYSAQCPFCQHPTSLTGETSWRPDAEYAQQEAFAQSATIATHQ